jgi:hypothetical protein
MPVLGWSHGCTDIDKWKDGCLAAACLGLILSPKLVKPANLMNFVERVAKNILALHLASEMSMVHGLFYGRHGSLFGGLSDMGQVLRYSFHRTSVWDFSYLIATF